ncbi:MAG: mannose-1-phosphate guanylyltransferase [Candidatus Babeliaceae bacterium]
MQAIFGVIMAGGSGVRLWPLSRLSKPKHLIPFSGCKTLLEITYERIKSIRALPHNCWLVTTQQQKESVMQIMGSAIDHYLIEPHARNTAPAILLTCLEIAQKNPKALVFFLPADHVVDEPEKFVTAMQKALVCTHRIQKIILLGIQPTYPSTEFGYVAGEAQGVQDWQNVVCFYEKPTHEKAQEYMDKGFLWNSGIFCGQVAVFLKEFRLYAPELFEKMSIYHKNKNPDLYAQLPALSFDQAILEKSQNCAVIPVNFAWSDVGTLETFLAAQRDTHTENVIAYQAHHNIVHTQKPVVLCDVDELCIIETDDVIFVSKKSGLKHMKQLVAHLAHQRSELL